MSEETNKQKTVEDLSIVEIKAEIFDRQQIINKTSNEIEILAKALEAKIIADSNPEG